MSYRHFAFLLLTSGLAFAQKPMSNDDVLRLVEQHLSTAQIVERINAAPSGFRLDFEDIDKLQRAGVPEIVVKAMNARQIGKRLDIRGVEIQAGANPITPATAAPTTPDPTMSAAAPVHTISERGWALETGRPEVTWHGGGGTFWNRGGGISSEWNTGAGLAVGITPHVAAIGDYNYSETVGFTSRVLGALRVHDLIGGVRVGTSGRIQGYLVAGAGVAHIGQQVLFQGSGSMTKAAIAFGGGVNVPITNRFGVLSDFRAVRPVDFIWYSRASGGFYFRF